MHKNKIFPSLWFTADGGNIANIINYYKNIFEQDFHAGHTIPLGNTPSGNTEMCEVTIFEQKYSMMCTEKEHHAFNDAVSFTLTCVDQNEIDKYWNYFTTEGKEVQCGWCIDKHGLRWQVIPYNLGTLMSKPNAFAVMMQQKKIIIADYLQ